MAYAGMVAYDGKRNAAFVATYADGTEVTLRGTYMIQKNCKGEVVFEDGRKASLLWRSVGRTMPRTCC